MAAMKADLAANPAWSGAPSPTDEFLLMFLRAEVFSPSAAANRYRKFWKVCVPSCFGRLWRGYGMAAGHATEV